MDKYAMASLFAASQNVGLVRGAVDDLVARAEKRFPGDESPSTAEVTSWLTTIKADPEAAHLFGAPPVQRQTSPIPAEHAHYSAEQKLAMHRPATPVKRRPERVTATPEQVASHAGMSAKDRLAWAHAQAREGG